MGQIQGHHHPNQFHGTGNGQQQLNGQLMEESMVHAEHQRQQKMLPAPMVSTKNQHNAGRRNLRSIMIESEQQRQQMEKRRQNRSRSLDPKSTHEIQAIEHSKSVRYGPRIIGGSSAKKAKEKELWNPEKAAAQLIGLQLQNPHVAQQNLLSLIGGQQPQQQQQLMPRPFRKQSGQMSMDLNLSADERRDLNVIGLSSHQIGILQKMWERSSESEIADCAKNILSHLLRSNAQMYQFFDLLGISDREIASSATFLRMSANFAIVLDFILTNIQEEAQKVCLALQCLGAQHARLSWPIESHHWALFMRCFEDNPPKEVFQNAEGHDLWKIMIYFLIIQMRQGYDRATGVESAPILLNVSGRSSPRYGRSPREIRKVSGPRQQQQMAGTMCPRSNTMAADGVE